MTIEFWWRQIFEILIIHKPSLVSLDVPQQIWARSVQPFWRLLDTNKETDKPNLYVDEKVRGTVNIFKCWSLLILLSPSGGPCNLLVNNISTAAIVGSISLFNILIMYNFFCLTLRLDQIYEQVFQLYSLNIISHHTCLRRIIEYILNWVFGTKSNM